jgi:O-antigen/teichoic acid export membrane protein
MEKAARHSALVIGAFVVTSLLNYAFGVGLSWFLEPALYGVLGVAQALLLLSALVVSAGFSWTANYDVAKGVDDGTRTRFRTAWLANLALGALLAVGLQLAYHLGILDLGPAYAAVIPLVGVTTFLLAARAVVNGAAQGLYRFGAVAANQVLEVGVKFAAGLALVAAGWGVSGVLAAFALGALLALAHSLWVVRGAQLWRGTGWFDARVLTLTGPLFVGMLGPALMLNLDILGLRLLAPPGRGDELAGFYQAAVILPRIPVFTARSLLTVLFSYAAGTAAVPATRATRRAGQGNRQTRKEDYSQAALRLWQRLLLPAGLALALAPEAALRIFFPEAYLAAAGALRVAAVGGLLLSLVTLLAGVAQAGGQRRAPALAAAAGAGAQMVVLAWLVPRWGPLAAATSLVAAGAVSLLVLVAWGAWPISKAEAHVRRRLAPRALFEALTPYALLALPLLLLPGATRSGALLQYVLAGVVYVAALVAQRRGRKQVETSTPRRLFHDVVTLLIGG